jgi:hypothetical protein
MYACNYLFIYLLHIGTLKPIYYKLWNILNHVFEVTVAFSREPPDDDPRIEKRVGVQF